MTAKRPKRTPYMPRLGYEPHLFDATADERCSRCPLPRGNRVHDPANLPTTAEEQHRADLARLGEREDED